MKIVVCKTADEVLKKYEEAEKISPAWERVTVFSWGDMLLLKGEIERLRGYERDARNCVESN